MHVNPDILKRIFRKKKLEDQRKKLDTFKQQEGQRDPHRVETEQVKSEDVTRREVGLDSDLTGMGASSLGTDIADTTRPAC